MGNRSPALPLEPPCYPAPQTDRRVPQLALVSPLHLSCSSPALWLQRVMCTVTKLARVAMPSWCSSRTASRPTPSRSPTAVTAATRFPSLRSRVACTQSALRLTESRSRTARGYSSLIATASPAPMRSPPPAPANPARRDSTPRRSTCRSVMPARPQQRPQVVCTREGVFGIASQLLTTAHLGASTIANCTCTPGHYSMVGGVVCAACPLGGSCAGGLGHPTAQQGFFPSSDPAVFLKCPLAESCLGSGQCAEGYQSRLW